MAKLTLDRDKVESCRQLAGKIVNNLKDFVDHHTTISIEKSVLRLLGIEESYKGRPLVDVVIEQLTPEELSLGICHWLGRALIAQQTTPIDLFLQMAEGRLKLQDFPEADPEGVHQTVQPLVTHALRRLDLAREARRKCLLSFSDVPRPLKFENIRATSLDQATEMANDAVQSGANCLAFLWEEPPADFQGVLKDLREVLDQLSDNAGRYVRMVIPVQGESLPEQVATAAVEKVDYLVMNQVGDIGIRKIPARRVVVDHYFSRLLMGQAGMVVHIDDRYFPAEGGHRVFSQILAAQLIEERYSLLARMNLEQVGIGHSFDADLTSQDSLLFEFAKAFLVRDLFPRGAVKYIAPQDSTHEHLFHLLAILTGQEIVELAADRFAGSRRAAFMVNAVGGLSDEIEWTTNGKMVRRARTLLDDTHKLLQRIERLGFFKTLEQGIFFSAGTEEEPAAVPGLIRKSSSYWNPFQKSFETRVDEETERFSYYPADRESSSGPPRSSHRRGGGGRGAPRGRGRGRPAGGGRRRRR